VPSRIQEAFRFVVKCDTADDHRYNPGTRLLASIGELDKYEPVRLRTQRLGLYLDSMFVAKSASARTVEFGSDDIKRYQDSLAWLRDSGDGAPRQSVAEQMTEHVRALASAIARYDTYGAAGQRQLLDQYKDLGTVDEARQVLGAACVRLVGTDPEEVWPEPTHRAVALAVVAEANARVATVDSDAPIEVRLLAQGTPINNVLQVELRSDLAQIREWLLGRLDRGPAVADCSLWNDVRTVAIPQPLPTPEPDSTQRLTVAELEQIKDATAKLTTDVRRFVTDAMCATLNPPCVDCTDNDVLLAHLELDGCDVVRVCSATREQVLPGGSAYGEWLPKLYQLRHLAQQVCCQPTSVYHQPSVPPDGPVTRPYVEGLLEDWPRTGVLEDMWSLLMIPAPGETVPKALHEQVYVVPSEVTDSMQELSTLRSQVSDLVGTVEALRAQLDTAREQVSRVRQDLPERLGDRLSELESSEPAPPKPAARRARPSSSRSAKPKSGESS
jgi:hypothetical protein